MYRPRSEVSLDKLDVHVNELRLGSVFVYWYTGKQIHHSTVEYTEKALKLNNERAMSSSACISTQARTEPASF